MIIVLILFNLLRLSSSVNLIKSGDFQQYRSRPFMVYNYTQSGFLFVEILANISSNMTSWYDKTMGIIEIKQLLLYPSTVVVDLSSTVPMTLCQDVILVPGNQYRLTFDMFTQLKIYKMTAKAYLNQVLLTQLYIDTNCTFKTQVYKFYADRSVNSLCFNETHSTAPPFPDSPNFGGLIDNISLFRIQTQHINFNCTINQIQQRIILEGNSTYNETLGSLIQERYDLFIEDKILDYKVESSESGHLLIHLQEKYSFNLSSIKFVEKLSYNQGWRTFIVQVDLSPPLTKQYFFYLEQSQVQILTKTKQLLIYINNLYSAASALTQMFFLAYFISMIIDIEFLSLFYVFTQITVIPDFTSKIYYDILKIVFSTESLIQYSAHLFRISLQNMNLDFQDIFMQKIDHQKNEQTWFGAYGFSSKVITSNLSSIFGLILSFIKLGLLKLVVKMLSKFCTSFRRVKVNIFSQILTQYCFMLPFILISLQANAINSLEKINDKWYKVTCLIMIFISFVLVFIYLFLPTFNRKRSVKFLSKPKQNKVIIQCLNDSISTKVREKSSSNNIVQFLTRGNQRKHFNWNMKKQKLQQKVKIRRKTMKIKFSQQASSIFLIFFIPFMSLISNSRLFLFSITFPIIFRFLSFLYPKKNEILLKKVIDVLIGIIWTLHHTIFMIFLLYEQKQLSGGQFVFIAWLGISAIFTVTGIILLQSFKFFLLVCIFFKHYFRLFCTDPHKKKNNIKKPKGKSQKRPRKIDKNKKSRSRQKLKKNKIKNKKEINRRKKQKSQIKFMGQNKLQEIEYFIIDFIFIFYLINIFIFNHLQFR